MIGIRLRLGVCLMPWLCACGSQDDFKPTPPFQQVADVRVWATAASAVGVYSNVYQVLAVADGHETFDDAQCPVVTDDGTTFTAVGDCTDSAKHDWTGQATVERDGDDRTLTLDDFNGDTGVVTQHWVEAGLHEFQATLELGSVTTIDYSGSVRGDYTGESVWNGSGQVKRHGVLPPNGEVHATTLDEIVADAVCSGQPSSGSTTLESGKDTAVITYDGETDCDDDQNAQLTVNGEDRGLIDGISCCVRACGATDGSRSGALALGIVLGLGLFRRRSRPTT